MGNKVSWNQEKNCFGSMNAESSSCPTIISSLSKSVPMIPRYGHQMCSVLLVGDVAWKTGRNHWGLSFFRARRGMSITDYRSRSISWVRASFLYRVHREPPKLFSVLFCQTFYISRVSLFFLFFFSLLCSSVACTNTEECWTNWLQVPLASTTVVARFRSRRSCRDLLTLHVFAANFRVVLVVVTFIYFFFSVVNLNTSFLSRKSLGVHVDWDVICSTTTRRVDIVVAFKSSGHCARELDFSVPTVFKPFEDGVDRAKACLVPLKKKPELEGCLQT